jgi:CxxC-x17-CxxC domain-containing protein
MNDQTITCRDCGTQFTFTAGEADFYASRGFDAPQRCTSCRAERKANRGDSAGGGSYERSGGGGGGFGGAREMHDATCSACGEQTKVPFAPTSGKPVYCRSCFESRRPSYVR